MTILPLLLMALIAGMTSAGATTILHSYLNHSLIDTAISHTSTANRKCDCRRLCMEDETCTAVTASGTGADVMCAFSSTPQPGMTSGVTGAITYVKSVPCEAPYEMVEGVGCLWFSDTTATFSTAKTSCPQNAGMIGLASPVTDVIFTTMAKHIIANSVFSYAFWCGLERIDGVWMWRDGHTIPGETGSSLWGHADPNDNSDCAIVRWQDGKLDNVWLVDGMCTQEYPFVCEMR